MTHVAAPTPPATVAADCRALVAALPDAPAPGARRRGTSPASPYTAAFGTPPIVVRCGVGVPAHDPMSFVAQVDGVDWLQLPAAGHAQHLVSFHSRLVVGVDIPDSYAGADVLAALSPLVARYGAAPG